MSFEYYGEGPPKCSWSDFVLRVPPSVGTKSDLLTEIAEAGKFPAYFGANWDALLDSLADLSWIDEFHVIVIHSDIPLVDDHNNRRIYLDLLRTVLEDWLLRGVQARHRLSVLFPINCRATIGSILDGDDR
jgi:hypothetical protein